MQVFQFSSVLSVVVGQGSRKYRALRRDWLSVLSAQCSVTHGDTTSPPSIRVELENPSLLGAAIELH